MKLQEVLNRLPALLNGQSLLPLLREAADRVPEKIIVLDDDPTGIQTVHDVHVYTDWGIESIRQGFAGENRVFYLLTNSRSFTVEETTRVHREIASNIAAVAKETGVPFQVILRGDSTLRGHYPLETLLVRDTLEKALGIHYDGEILRPLFEEEAEDIRSETFTMSMSAGNWFLPGRPNLPGTKPSATMLPILRTISRKNPDMPLPCRVCLSGDAPWAAL